MASRVICVMDGGRRSKIGCCGRLAPRETRGFDGGVGHCRRRWRLLLLMNIGEEIEEDKRGIVK